mmetsp:Transcript_144846/g.252587  ORF Transcript_144846/g.252587 Transcript_144846/m.252587 type:complete len:106 (-) Transcript_144846:81-398(-)
MPVSVPVTMPNRIHPTPHVYPTPACMFSSLTPTMHCTSQHPTFNRPIGCWQLQLFRGRWHVKPVAVNVVGQGGSGGPWADLRWASTSVDRGASRREGCVCVYLCG